MGKTILKTALITFASLIVASFLLFGFLYLCVPSTIVKMSDDLGFDSLNINAKVRVFEQNSNGKDINNDDELFLQLVDLVESASISNSNTYEVTNTYGTKLIECAKFEEYASTTKQVNFKQYIYGSVSVARYKLGDLTSASNLALSINKTTFTKNNAVVYLLMEVKEVNVALDKTTLYNAMNEQVSISTLSVDEQSYFNSMLNSLQN